MPASAEPPIDQPVIGPEQDFASVSEALSALVLVKRTPLWWWGGAALSVALLGLLVAAAGYLLYLGVGVWGVNIPVAWGFALVDYVWWIGIANGCTFISTFFLVVGADWRGGVARFAETIAVFAAAAAGLMPIFHLGRQGLFYWLFPYPNVMGMWPQFRSPLQWDFFTLLCYIICLAVFWYTGLIPDCATLRDRARSKPKQIFYGILALGWRGSARHWRNYRLVYFLMAAVLSALVVAVHGVVGLDFAGGLVPGWHSTQWPAYFFIGALLSGWGATLMLIIPLRRLYRIERLITERHLAVMAKFMLVSSLMLAYCYGVEAFQAFYRSDPIEHDEFLFTVFGMYAPAYWLRNSLSVFLPQLLWFPAIRRSEPVLFLLSFGVVLGLWFDAFSFVVPGLARNYMPSEWGIYVPTAWDWGILFGSVGLMFAGLLAFLRLLPLVSMSALREMLVSKGRG